MSKIKKEVKIGIAFVIALFIIYFGINFLKGINVFKPANSYTVVFTDVSGLLVADAVTINGLKIGQVLSLNLNPDDPKTVLVNIHLDKDVKVPLGSKVLLDAGMLSGSSLIIEPQQGVTEYYTQDDLIPGEKKSGLMDAAARVVPKLENLLPRLDSILSNVEQLTGDPALKQTLNNINTLSGELAGSSRQVNSLLTTLNKDLPMISKNLVSTTGNIEQFSHQVRGIDLVATFNKIDTTMANVQYMSGKFRSSDNSIGLLLNDKKLYEDLNRTLENASFLLEDVKLNPSRYINVKVF